MLTIEEAKKMEGTEFIYQFEDGDTIRAFVKKFDAEKGLTCMSLETKTERGYIPPFGQEEDGTFCVIGYKFSGPRGNEPALEALEIIRDHGVYIEGLVNGTHKTAFADCPFK